MNEQQEDAQFFFDELASRSQGLLSENLTDVVLLGLLTREEQIYNHCLQTESVNDYLRDLFTNNTTEASLFTEMFEVFSKVEIEISKEILSSPGMIKEPKEILQYEEQDFRLKEMIMQNEAKVKHEANINAALRKEPLHPVIEDEEEERRAEQARLFAEKMKREAEERNRRMKELAQKREEELKREEQQREANEKRQQLELVKRRQNENIMKLQEAKEKRENELEERKRFMMKVAHQRSVKAIPLYVKLQADHEIKSKLWYEQFSRKEVLKYAGVNPETSSSVQRKKDVSHKTFNLPSAPRLRQPINRHTEMPSINSNLIKLERLEEIEKINEQIKSEEASLPSVNRLEPIDTEKRLIHNNING